MPFELAVEIKTSSICIDVYTRGADAYETGNGKYNAKNWQVRYEKPAFANLDELAATLLDELSVRFFRKSKEDLYREP
jgi:hypothetical protein